MVIRKLVVRIYFLFNHLTNQPINQSSVGNNLLFAGRQYDPESGLYYFRYRYYDAQLGRFINPEPVPNVFLVNLYDYVFNNPVNCLDPLGLTGGGGYGGYTPLPPDPQEGVTESGTFQTGSGYADINVTAGYYAGVTFGWLISNSQTYFYFGAGFVTPGASVSVTYSPSDVSPGWAIGAGFTAGGAGQIGYSFGKDGGLFWERGGGWPPGISVTFYYVFDKK